MLDDQSYEDKLKGYSLDELESIASYIDREKHPERYEMVLAEINRRGDAGRTADGEGAGSDATLMPFEFTGKAGEYFRIWIVNIALSVLTLGIYSAWAKVRKNRYIYGSTLLHGVPFEYLADPVRILIGRLIVFGLFASYTAISYFQPLLIIFLWPIGAIVFPWIVVRALAFKARYSAYRNIHFNFKATYGQSAKVFLGFGILVAFSFGLAYPFWVFRQKKFAVERSSYGQTPLRFSAKAEQFFAPYIAAFILVIIGGFVFSMVVWPLMPTPDVSAADPEDIGFFTSLLTMLPGFLLYLVVYLPVFVFLTTTITNAVWSNIHIGQSRLQSSLRTGPMIGLYLTNAVAIILSLGLMIPWATIRMTRYKMQHLNLLAVEDLDSFVAGEEERVGAAGQEIAEFFDFDIGL